MHDFFARTGPFDHLVYTAGESLQLGPLAGTSLAQARQFFELRFWGTITAVKYGLNRGGQHLLGDGGVDPCPAVELAPVRVNIVSPGFVRTPLWNRSSAAE